MYTCDCDALWELHVDPTEITLVLVPIVVLRNIQSCSALTFCLLIFAHGEQSLCSHLRDTEQFKDKLAVLYEWSSPIMYRLILKY